jgi:DNA polymerase-3 subunit epsilon
VASYFLRTTGMSRGITDGTSKKNACTWHREYFRLDDEGLLSSVNEYGDGLLFYSEPAPLPFPCAFPLPLPCSSELFQQAYARCTVYTEKREAERKAAKEFAKSLKSGMLFNAHAAEEAGAAEPTGLADAQHWLHDFTVLDTEFQGPALLELAAVRYVNWAPVEVLQTFVAFAGQVNKFTTDLTGITARDLVGAPSASAVLKSFRQMAGPSVLVAHNASADRGIIERTRTALGATEPMPNEWLCTMAVARQRYPKPHGLGELCSRLGIPTAGAHRALRDVEMCFELLQRMHREAPVAPLPVRTPAKAKLAVGTSPLFEKAA